MKKLLVLALLVFGMNTYAQPTFITSEYVTITGFVDPTASIKEDGLDFGAELRLVSHWKYVKAEFQSFNALEGSYFDMRGGFGVNMTTDYFERTYYYAGINLGLIKRGITNNDPQTYPLAGVEAGFKYQATDTILFGFRGTVDYREDKLYTAANPDWEYSGHLLLGIKLN